MGGSASSPTSTGSPASSPSFSQLEEIPTKEEKASPRKARRRKTEPVTRRLSSVSVAERKPVAVLLVVQQAVREQRIRERKAAREDRFKRREPASPKAVVESDSEDEVVEESTDRVVVSPQRRLFYLEVPIGASGALTKRVFEVRPRDVLGCPQQQYIDLSTPSMHHATTSSLLLRWQPDSWADVKLIRRYELQWKYEGLPPGEHLEAWSKVTRDGEDDEVAYFYCDNEFCSAPSRVVKLIDTRAEVELNGLPGGCGPLLFRVRCKVSPSKFEQHKVGGWSCWSAISDPVQTLPAVCPEMTPEVIRATAHTLSLQWTSPNDPRYGKIVTFRLFGRCSRSTEGGEQSTEGIELGIGVEDAITNSDGGWVCLYEGTGCRFSIGIPPIGGVVSCEAAVGSPSSADDVALIRAQAEAPSLLQGSCDGCIGLQQDSLFSLVLFSTTGSWFHGEFRRCDVRSLVANVRTARAVPDAPDAPSVPPYHGAVTSHSIELRWCPPSTYGFGHDASSYRSIAAKSQGADDWFGLSLVAGESKAGVEELARAEHRKRLDTSETTDADDAAAASGAEVGQSERMSADWSALRLEAESATVRQLLREGWEQRMDMDGFQFWHNTTTGGTSWQLPEPSTVPVERFVLLGKPTHIDPDWDDFRVLYEGEERGFLAGGPDCPMPLLAGTGYTFAIRAANTMGTGAASTPLLVDTLPEPGIGSEDIELPMGWVECWDPSSGHCYYYNEASGENQWTHPAALAIGRDHINDNTLGFRKKRFRLLHLLQERHPPPKGYAALRLVLARSTLLQDSFAQLRGLPTNSLRLRTNITFEGEDGIDSGGLTNEWFMQISRKLLDPALGLFLRHDASGLSSLSPAAQHAPSAVGGAADNAELFRFAGIVAGMAIQSKHLVDMEFATSVYRFVLGEPIVLDDMREVDPLYHTSLCWISDPSNDIDGIIFETFSATVVEPDATETTVDLIPHGRDVDVTQENKKKYVQRIVEWRLVESVRSQLEAFVDGLSALVETSELQSLGFTAGELRRLINGSRDIPVRKLRRHARYANGYNERSKPVEYLWDTLDECTDLQRSDLLNFVTGCPKLPLDDLSIEIVRSELGPDALPSSHTCFNQLVLPEYVTREGLREKLFIALESSEGFHMT